MQVFSTEEILPIFSEGGDLAFCEVLGLDTWFYCNGSLLHCFEEISLILEREEVQEILILCLVTFLCCNRSLRYLRHSL